MAQVINTISSSIFSLNGVQYSRIFQPLAIGANNIGIYQVYDTKLQLLGPIPYDEFVIDGGAAPISQSAALAALNPVLFATPVTQGGSVLIGSQLVDVAQIGDGTTAMVNIGAIDVAGALTLDGSVLQVRYSGIIDRVSGTPIIKLSGYSSNLITGNVIAAAGSDIPWVIEADIMRVSSTIAQWSATFKVEGQETQVLTGERTGLDFEAGHSMSLGYFDHQNLDDFLLRFGYVNKLS